MPRQPKPRQLAEAPLRPSMNATRISPSVARELGSANAAVGAALGDVISAFGQVASRAAAASEKQNESLFDLEFNQGMNSIMRDADSGADPEGNSYRAVPQKIGDLYSSLSQKYPAGSRNKEVRRNIRHQPRILRYGNLSVDRYRGSQLKLHTGRENSSLASALQSIKENPSDDNFMALTTDLTNMVDASEGMSRSPAEAAQRRQEIWSQIATARLETLRQNDPQAAIQFSKKLQELNRSDPSQIKAAPNVKFGRVNVTRHTGTARRSKIKGVVIHHSEGSTDMRGLAEWSNKSNTGYHLYVDRGGRVIQWAPDNVIMNHAGKSRGKPGDIRPDLRNANTIGIGMMTKKGQEPTRAQLATVKALTQQLSKKHGFSMKDVVGHGEVAIGHRQPTEGKFAEVLRSGDGAAPAPAQQKSAETGIIDPRGLSQGQQEFNLPEIIGQKDFRALQSQVQDDPNVTLGEVLPEDDVKRLSELLPGQDIENITVGDALALYGQVSQGGGQELGPGIPNLFAANDDPSGSTPSGTGRDGLITVQGEKGTYNFLPEHLQFLGKDFWRAYNRAARERVRTVRRERANLAQAQEEQAVADIRRTGDAHDDYDAGLRQHLTPKQQRGFETRREIAKREFLAMREVHDTSTEELEGRLRDLEDEIVAPDGHVDIEAEKAYNRVEKKLRKIKTLRQSDPGQSVLETHEVKSYQQSIPAGEASSARHRFGLADAMVKAQTRLGLEPTPLTKRQARALLAPLARAAPRERRKLAHELIKEVHGIYGERYSKMFVERAFALFSGEDEDDRRMLRSRLRRVQSEAPSDGSDLEESAPARRNIYDQFDNGTP